MVYAKYFTVSNTPDGPPDYQEGTDWRYNPNLANKFIDWSPSGKEPRPGSKYYVTGAQGIEARPVTITPAPGGFTLASAPTKGQAVYAEFLYGKPSADGSTLAYQQSSAPVTAATTPSSSIRATPRATWASTSPWGWTGSTATWASPPR